MNTIQVLIVDDEPGMRRGSHKALDQYIAEIPDLDMEVAFDCDMAATGEEALDKLSQHAYDLVLLDYKLTDMTGLDILEKIQDRLSNMHAIMITAYASLEVAISATKNGAFDFMAKPYSPDEIRSTVTRAATNLLIQRHARKLAEERKQVRFQFLSVLSHELKAPIGAVEGYLKIMKERTAGNDIADYEKIIARSLARLDGMKKLIYDMLDLTRIESGQKKRTLSEINLRETAELCMENLIPDAEDRGIGLTLHMKGPEIFTADSGEIEIVLNNLISNAVKYNRDNGHVNVRIDNRDGILTITVQDTGIGMTPDEQKKLFGEFVRIKNDKTRHIEGSGLGLSTLKKLTALYDGSVNVKSIPDEGSTFTVVLKERRD